VEGNIPQQQQPPPPLPHRVFNKETIIYASLNLPRDMHNFPDNYLKLLPKFNGEDEVTSLEHLLAFDYFTYNQDLEHQDVCMRIFLQDFEGEVRK